MKALIVSLRFHPGHFSHLIANYNLFLYCGFTPYLYVNKSFNQMDKNNKYHRINNSGEFSKLKNIDIAVFWFPSLMNIIEIIRLRIYFKTKIIYIYHEPFDSIKNYYNSGFRFKKIFKICLINIVNIPVILLSHKIVLPSLLPFSLYKNKYTLLNKNYSLIPLIFEDESLPDLEKVNKIYISYIGTVAPNHAFDKFVEFVECAMKNSWFPNMKFLIATGSEIPIKEKNILDRYYQSGRIIIQENHPMTNEKINMYFRDSLVIWNAYNRSMQSGILPKAYMFGAAVISLSSNPNDFVDNHKTGIIINDNKDANEIKNAVEEIHYNKDMYFQNCRGKFLKTFYYKSNTFNYLSLLEK
jgi:hypothetical protein